MAARSKTWWGAEFLDALEQIMDSGRLSRGRGYASPHRLMKFEIKGSKIEATVRGNINAYFGVTKEPHYKVSVELEKVSTPAWKKILAQLGHNANWVTHFILGEVPPTIENAFAGSKVKLLPRSSKEIIAHCNCPDWANPCKHIAGVYYHVAVLVDRDPFLLFELRGIDRKALMAAVSKSDFGMALGSENTIKKSDVANILREPRFPVVRDVQEKAVPTDGREFWLGKPLSTDVLSSQPMPHVSVLPLRRAGDYPEFWHQDASFLEAMGDAYTRIAKNIPDTGLPGRMIVVQK